MFPIVSKKTKERFNNSDLKKLGNIKKKQFINNIVLLH